MNQSNFKKTKTKYASKHILFEVYQLNPYLSRCSDSGGMKNAYICKFYSLKIIIYSMLQPEKNATIN